MRFLLQTFGCKSNQYESQAIREDLVEAGFYPVESPEEAELFILNSCAVTSRAGASCRNAYRKALRANPELKVVFTGCAVDVKEPWLAEIKADIIITNAKKHAISELLLLHGVTPDTVLQCSDDRFALSIKGFAGHTRAFIKIQDGCDNFCSYCTVPLARGRPESRHPRDILEEAARLVGNGHPELALTGINVGAYNHDGLTLAGLLLRLAETKGLVRLRLGSVEPQEVTPELVEAMRGHEKIAPHIHLPLQSGDPEVLKTMRRRYTPEEFLAKSAMLKDRLDNPAITSDVIVGFPGEDAEAFENTYELCSRAGFARLHVFLFSPRPGTPAAMMRNRSHDRDIEERKNRLIQLGEREAVRFAESCIGMRERAISESGECLTDRYLRTTIKGLETKPGETYQVRVIGTLGPQLISEACF
jgi:MiaB-like tRNA modifying enzyme